MTDHLLDVFAVGLNTTIDRLSDETSPDNNSAWDSLAAMELVMLIEERFETKLSTRDIMKMRSIGAARDVLRAKGVEGL